jgi:hypothetical protein
MFLGIWLRLYVMKYKESYKRKSEPIWLRFVKGYYQNAHDPERVKDIANSIQLSKYPRLHGLF